MKQTILRYGLYGAIAICALFMISLTVGKNLDYGMQEVIGYASMIISLSFVFFGIKHFRDKFNEGKVTFGKALLIGMLITLITAIAFGFLDFIYVKFINPDFQETYYAESIARLEETLPAAEFEVQKAALEAQKEMFMNPLVSFALMTTTVLIVGFIISLISSLILQRKT